jgi:hypothetical protein
MTERRHRAALDQLDGSGRFIRCSASVRPVHKSNVGHGEAKLRRCRPLTLARDSFNGEGEALGRTPAATSTTDWRNFVASFYATGRR